MDLELDLNIKRNDLREIRQEYLDERKIYIESEYNAIAGFARALLTLSAGALGFSLTFVHAVMEDPEYLGWLVATWILFAMALLTTTAALYSSHMAFRKGRSILREDYKARVQDYLQNYGKPPDQHIATEVNNHNGYAQETKEYNRIAFAFFVFGAITLLIFASANIL